MAGNRFENLSRKELDEFIDELLIELRSRSVALSTGESDVSGREAVVTGAPEETSSETVGNEPQDDGGKPKAPVLPSKEQADALLERLTYKKRYRRTLISTIVSLIVVVTAAIVISAVLMPVIRISGGSMDPVYKDGDILVLFNGKSYTNGQLCCVSWQNKLLVKRIIGMSGDLIDIDPDGNVYVNGAALDEPYAINKSLGECDIEFPYEVPEGQLFIMGDRRDTSIDSRSTAVGCIGEKQVIGRVLFRVWPLGNS